MVAKMRLSHRGAWFGLALLITASLSLSASAFAGVQTSLHSSKITQLDRKLLLPRNKPLASGYDNNDETSYDLRLPSDFVGGQTRQQTNQNANRALTPSSGCHTAWIGLPSALSSSVRKPASGHRGALLLSCDGSWESQGESGEIASLSAFSPVALKPEELSTEAAKAACQQFGFDFAVSVSTLQDAERQWLVHQTSPSPLPSVSIQCKGQNVTAFEDCVSLSTTASSSDSESLIALSCGYSLQYYGGFLPTSRVTNVSLLWYGEGWASASSALTINITEDFVRKLGASSWWSGATNNLLNHSGGNTITLQHSHFYRQASTASPSSAVSPGDIEELVKQFLMDSPSSQGPDSLLVILLASGITESTTGREYVHQHCIDYCGYHRHLDYTSASLGATFSPYAVIGYPLDCPSSNCDVFGSPPSPSSPTPPNGDRAADSLAPLIAHQLLSMTTNALSDAWVDLDGLEAADKCVWNFAGGREVVPVTASTTTVGSRSFLLPSYWDISTQSCARVDDEVVGDERASPGVNSVEAVSSSPISPLAPHAEETIAEPATPVYIIWYGDWSLSEQAEAKGPRALLQTNESESEDLADKAKKDVRGFVNNLGHSQWWLKASELYFSSISRQFVVSGQCKDASSRGETLSAHDTEEIIKEKAGILTNLTSHTGEGCELFTASLSLAAQGPSIYVLLLSEGVTEQENSEEMLCKDYCHRHSHFPIHTPEGDREILYAVAGLGSKRDGDGSLCTKHCTPPFMEFTIKQQLLHQKRQRGISLDEVGDDVSPLSSLERKTGKSLEKKKRARVLPYLLSWSIASVLLNTVTNPLGKGWHNEKGMEAADVCPSVFQKSHGSDLYFPLIWDPHSHTCAFPNSPALVASTSWQSFDIVTAVPTSSNVSTSAASTSESETTPTSGHPLPTQSSNVPFQPSTASPSDSESAQPTSASSTTNQPAPQVSENSPSSDVTSTVMPTQPSSAGTSSTEPVTTIANTEIAAETGATPTSANGVTPTIANDETGAPQEPTTLQTGGTTPPAVTEGSQPSVEQSPQPSSASTSSEPMVDQTSAPSTSGSTREESSTMMPDTSAPSIGPIATSIMSQEPVTSAESTEATVTSTIAPENGAVSPTPPATTQQGDSNTPHPPVIPTSQSVTVTDSIPTSAGSEEGTAPPTIGSDNGDQTFSPSTTEKAAAQPSDGVATQTPVEDTALPPSTPVVITDSSSQASSQPHTSVAPSTGDNENPAAAPTPTTVQSEATTATSDTGEQTQAPTTTSSEQADSGAGTNSPPTSTPEPSSNVIPGSNQPTEFEQSGAPSPSPTGTHAPQDEPSPSLAATTAPETPSTKEASSDTTLPSLQPSQISSPDQPSSQTTAPSAASTGEGTETLLPQTERATQAPLTATSSESTPTSETTAPSTSSAEVTSPSGPTTGTPTSDVLVPTSSLPASTVAPSEKVAEDSNSQSPTTAFTAKEIGSGASVEPTTAAHESSGASDAPLTSTATTSPLSPPTYPVTTSISTQSPTGPESSISPPTAAGTEAPTSSGTAVQDSGTTQAPQTSTSNASDGSSHAAPTSAAETQEPAGPTSSTSAPTSDGAAPAATQAPPGQPTQATQEPTTSAAGQSSSGEVSSSSPSPESESPTSSLVSTAESTSSPDHPSASEDGSGTTEEVQIGASPPPSGGQSSVTESTADNDTQQPPSSSSATPTSESIGDRNDQPTSSPTAPSIAPDASASPSNVADSQSSTSSAAQSVGPELSPAPTSPSTASGTSSDATPAGATQSASVPSSSTIANTTSSTTTTSTGSTSSSAASSGQQQQQQQGNTVITSSTDNGENMEYVVVADLKLKHVTQEDSATLSQWFPALLASSLSANSLANAHLSAEEITVTYISSVSPSQDSSLSSVSKTRRRRLSGSDDKRRDLSVAENDSATTIIDQVGFTVELTQGSYAAAEGILDAMSLAEVAADVGQSIVAARKTDKTENFQVVALKIVSRKKSSSSSTSSDSSGLSRPVLVAVVVASVIGALTILAVGWMLYVRRKAQQQQEHQDTDARGDENQRKDTAEDQPDALYAEAVEVSVAGDSKVLSV